MLGHKLVQTLRAPIEAVCTVRRLDGLQRFGFYCPDAVVPGVDAFDLPSVERAVERVKPQAVVNCIGIVKQHALAEAPIASLTVNALFPHRLNEVCARHGARLVHVSTDCVFDGARGTYKESDVTDASDLYGRTKALGELTDGAVTLRTSIIGRELSTKTGLVEWFLSKRGGRVGGFTNARFSGLTTTELSRVVARVLLEHEGLTGLWHVASEPISKHDLLRKLNDGFGTRTEIAADGSVRIDRTLDGSAFQRKTGYVAPGWDAMVAEMAADPTPYDTWSN
jgi:dTDP-4-dehydrorhamnose reductase